MSSTGNQAEGKRPSVEEEMARFKTVSFKDGDIHTGVADDNADQMARENRAGDVNRRTHAENQAAGPVDTGAPAEGEDKGGKEKAPIELTDEESEAALAAAEEKEGGELSDAEKEAVLQAALASKVRSAAVAARKAAKAARYDDNHKARRAAERENATLRRQLDNMQRQLDAIAAGKPLTGDKPASKDNAAGKPDHTDAKYQYGELDPKYLADLARYEATEALRAETERTNTSKQTAAEAAKAAEFEESREAFAEAGEELFDDFREVVMDNGWSKDNPGGWPCSTTVAELLLDSDHGAEIAYELASNIPEARRVSKMTAARQAIWFGQQEAKLSAESAANAPKPKEKPAAGAPAGNANTGKQVRESRAPAPLSRLNGSGGNRVPDGSTTDFRAFEAAAMAPPKR